MIKLYMVPGRYGISLLVFDSASHSLEKNFSRRKNSIQNAPMCYSLCKVPKYLSLKCSNTLIHKSVLKRYKI